MATATTSGPQQQVNMPALDLRRFNGVLVAAEGVRTSNDLIVSQRAAGANMSVDVSAGQCYIQDDHAAGGGFYHAVWAATDNVVIAAADPTNPRVDRIVVRVRDQFLGDATNAIDLFVVQGAPTAGATLANTTGAAAVPGSCLLLANVLVPAAAASIVTASIDTTGASNNAPPVRPYLGALQGRSPGFEVAYNEFTATVATTTATVAAPLDLVAAAAFAADGVTAYIVEVTAPNMASGGAVSCGVSLWDSATDLGVLFDSNGSIVAGVPLKVSRRLIPTAGQHTYKARIWTNSATNFQISAGAGGAGTRLPGSIRVTRA